MADGKFFSTSVTRTARVSFHIYKASENAGAEIFNPESGVVLTQLVNEPEVSRSARKGFAY